MKKTIVTVGVGILLAISSTEAKTVALDISMSAKGPVVGKESLAREGEQSKNGFLVRTKALKAGGISLLVKSEKDGGEITVFGRKVKLSKNGQYQIKWDAESGKIATAEVGAEVSKWVAPPSLYPWFSNKGAKDGKEKEEDGEVIRLPRKIVFAPGEGPEPGAGSGEGFAGMGGESQDETLDLPPLRDIREKLGSINRDFSKNPRPSGNALAGGATRYYPAAVVGSPRNGADMAITPLGRGGGGTFAGDDEYVIQPGDTIDLNFYRVQRVTVDMRGDIRVVSSVGSAESVVRAAGKTPQEVSNGVLHSGLNFQSVPEPALKVNVAKFSDRAVVVVGRVNKPGKIPLEEGEIVGITGILKKAGGVAGGNKGAIVYVKRGDKVTKADLGTGEDEALSHFRIMPGDIVTVNKK